MWAFLGDTRDEREEGKPKFSRTRTAEAIDNISTPWGTVRLELAKQIQETGISFPYFLICTAWKRPFKAKITQQPECPDHEEYLAGILALSPPSC